jgi:hypothetical protein
MQVELVMPIEQVLGTLNITNLPIDEKDFAFVVDEIVSVPPGICATDDISAGSGSALIQKCDRLSASNILKGPRPLFIAPGNLTFSFEQTGRNLPTPTPSPLNTSSAVGTVDPIRASRSLPTRINAIHPTSGILETLRNGERGLGGLDEVVKFCSVLSIGMRLPLLRSAVTRPYFDPIIYSSYRFPGALFDAVHTFLT